MIVYVIALLCLAALVMLWRDRPSGGRRWTDDGFATAAVLTLIVGGLAYDSTVVGGSRTVQLATLLLVVGATVCYLGTGGRERRFVAPALAFIPMAMSLYMFVLSALGSTEFLIFSRLAPVVLWLCLGALLASGGVNVRTMCRMIVGVTCTIGVLLPVTAGAVVPCTAFKCGPLGQLLTGPMASGNYLAQLAALAMLIAIFQFDGALRQLLVVTMVIMLAATDSRTCQIASIIGLLTGLAIKARWGAGQRRMRSQSLALLVWPVVVGSSVFGLYLIYNFTDGDFSNRANTWARAVKVLGSDWSTGLGGQAWSDYQDVGALPVVFPHSEYLLVLFWGGIFSVAAYTVMLAVVVCRAARVPHLLPLCGALMMFLLTLGLTEAFWNPTAVDGHSFFLLLILAFGYVPAHHLTVSAQAAEQQRVRGPASATAPKVRVGRHG